MDAASDDSRTPLLLRRPNSTTSLPRSRPRTLVVADDATLPFSIDDIPESKNADTLDDNYDINEPGPSSRVAAITKRTPLPKKQMLVLCIMRITEPVSYMVVGAVVAFFSSIAN